MAGTISLSLSQQFDGLGKPLAGGLLYTIQAGTTSTPQNSYFDSALTLPQPNPIVLDAFGRIPQFFIADGSIKVRLTDKSLATIFTADNILVVGPSGGGGGGGTVDPTTVLQTGDIKQVYGTGVISGFVRANAKTIGSATSGATERANLDCQNLFVFLWNTDASLAVSGGRGASAAADWAANKTIALPDFRGRVLAGFDDMGNSAAGRLTTVTMTGNGIGAVSSAAETKSLATANLPPYSPAGSLSLSTSVSTSVTTGVTGSASVNSSNWVASNSNDSTGQSVTNVGGSGGITVSLGGGGASVSKIVSTGSISASASSSASSSATPTGSFTGSAQGGTSTAFPIVQPTIFVTSYMKL